MDHRQFSSRGGKARAKKHSTKEIQSWGKKGGLKSAKTRKKKAKKKGKKKSK
jgi:hypothetical protein